MYVTLDNILLVGSMLVMASVFASKSNKFGIPSLLLFLVVGILAGAEGFANIRFDDTRVARFIGNMAMVLILFSGGLDTRFTDVRRILFRGVLLSTVGVMLTASLVGIFAWSITPMSLTSALLLGCIVSSTDASTVFSVLRSKHFGLKGRIRPLLEFESGSNDPMAYFLTILMIAIISASDDASVSVLSGVAMFLSQFVIGALVGVLLGYMSLRVINRINLDFEGLYSVLMLAIAMFIYAISAFLNANGFLAVYLAAIVIGNNNFVHKRSITKHFDGQAWLMQIVMFITLGLMISPRHMWAVAGYSLAIFAFLLFVARPITVFAMLAHSRFNVAAMSFISWVGLRGAVPIVFAIYAVDADVPYAHDIFAVVSFVSILSVGIQGTTIPYVAKLLNLNVPMNVRKRSKLDVELASKVKSISLEVDITANTFCCGKSIVEVGFPAGLTVSVIERDGMYIVPEGKTIFERGDKVTVVADSVDTLQKFSSILETYK